MYPFPINIRSFAPFKEFGGWFAGDNRGYSTSMSATSRLAQSFSYGPTGKVTLKAGDVWKYGETTSGERYSEQYSENEKVRQLPQFYGTQMQIKVEEKRKI